MRKVLICEQSKEFHNAAALGLFNSAVWKEDSSRSEMDSSIEKYANLEIEKNALYSLYISKRNQLEKEGKDTLLATEHEYKRLLQISIEQALIENKIAKDIPFDLEKKNSDPRIIAFRKQAKKLTIKNLRRN